MPTSSPTRRTFTISFPPELAASVEALAKSEHRTTSELFREAFRVYRAQQFRKVMQELNDMAKENDHNGYKEEDVERLVKEFRAENRRSRESVRK